MTTLQLNTSIFGAAGESTRLASQFVRTSVARRGGRGIVRDLARDPVPHLDAERFQAFLAKDPTPAQQAARAAGARGHRALERAGTCPYLR